MFSSDNHPASTAASGPDRRDGLFSLIVRGLLLAAALVVALWFLHQVQTAVLVLTVAAIVAVFLNAPVHWLESRGLSRGMSAAAVLVTLLVVTGLVSWLVVPRLAEEVPRLINLLPELARDLAGELSTAFGDSPAVERQLSQLVEWLLDTIRSVWKYASAMVEAVVLGIVVFALVLFMLLDPRPILATYLHLMPAHLRGPAARAFEQSSRMIVGWGISNLILGGIRGVVVYFFLQWMSVPAALVWSLVAFIAIVIPQVGFYLMAIPPVLVATAEGATTAIWTAIFLTVFNEIEGKFVAPRLRGEVMHLHPAYLLSMTVLMAFAFGILGVLIAAPVAGIVKAYVDEFYFARQDDDRKTQERVDRMLTPDLRRSSERGEEAS